MTLPNVQLVLKMFHSFGKVPHEAKKASPHGNAELATSKRTKVPSPLKVARDSFWIKVGSSKRKGDAICVFFDVLMLNGLLAFHVPLFTP